MMEIQWDSKLLSMMIPDMGIFMLLQNHERTGFWYVLVCFDHGSWWYRWKVTHENQLIKNTGVKKGKHGWKLWQFYGYEYTNDFFWCFDWYLKAYSLFNHLSSAPNVQHRRFKTAWLRTRFPMDCENPPKKIINWSPFINYDSRNHFGLPPF